MAEILSQEEIDALLSAIGKEEAPQELPETIIEEKVSIYDFKRPDKVSKEQIRALKNLHDKFARNFSSKLSGFLRTIIEIDVASVDQMTYGEFVLSLSQSVSFNVINLYPLEGSGIIAIEPDIGFVLIDRLLGGFGTTFQNIRPFTDIEQSILLDIVNLMLSDLKNIWAPIAEIRFEVTAQETSPNVVQIVAPSEVVVLIVFEVKMGDYKGIINFCIPVITLEPILTKISTHDMLSISRKEHVNRVVNILQILDNVLMRIEVYLGDFNISVENFLNLKPNDIYILHKNTNEFSEVYCNGVKKFEAKLGKVKNKKAIKIAKLTF
ncbi:MAG: flagellar motor switch protein FliM [Desulfurella sp.]|uniref:flagellar motor switch protein FliM n=1 Tax=Desulfurella sp. TaxID=1962857 RepID=UPI000CC0EFCC|nr:flagellar motor switch protein FliM [Desulfurella sp.]PMP87304.1 MAG: flagellar motor switch protein FliM [Desulfurella sp.]HEX13740.1 flagellar motor switch protein FliM [Desulfurella acetivorans]